MIRTRINLHKKLCDLLGSKNVYFNPPEGKKISYPCIIYHYAKPFQRHADDIIYTLMKCYDVTYISKNPTDQFPDHFLQSMPYCNMDRIFISDGLVHTVFTIYF